MGQNTATLQYLQTMKAVYITYCSYAKPARYDVFERIGFYINNTWLCLSAPSKVTGYDDEASESWNYLKLRPCAINDKNQRWAIKDNTIYSADSRFKVVHTKWYAAIAKDTKGFYTHRLTDSMNEWINTVAKPMNLTIKTILAWTFVDSSSWSLYYIQNNSSYAGEGALNYLYCNPENGHIAQYYNKDGSLFMYVVVRSDSSGTRRTAHAEPILRTQNGLVIIPTNATNHTREQFASLLNPLTSVDEVLYRLSLEGTRQIYSLGIYQITGIYENPLNLMITQSNCSGDGEHRRGDRRVFSSDLINQCSSRRCLLQ